ncbi:MAG: PqqD family protein, partial [Bacteroidales bacterium]|nr:PqqD family protein [Bacteroidales bacterium]
MFIQERLRVNSPHAVHDTIDGETIIVNLRNGHYYSFDKTGVIIWELIAQGGDLGYLLDLIQERTGTGAPQLAAGISDFIAALLREELVVADDDDAPPAGAMSREEVKAMADLWGENPDIPVLNRYADMQGMLLLDPIHDTDEQGWPKARLD